MPDLGVRLQLFIGPTVPVPAPYPVIDALRDISVSNNDQGRDGFQMSFSLGKDTPLDYGLLLNDYFEPTNRVVIMVLINTLPEILIDGVITDHQFSPSNKPGEATLTVTGEDVSLMMDLEERSETYPNQPDWIIVLQLLANYARFGLVPMVTPTTDVPIELDRIPTQQGTDLGFIQELARRNGFVFYIEPQAPGASIAYWGLDNRLDIPQPALTMNMGADTNVDSSINFRFNALGPEAPQVTILEENTKIAIPIPVPQSLRPPLAVRPATPLRRTIARDAANLNAAQGALRGLSSSSQASDAVTGNGELDAVRYGHALRARRLVGVRGVGLSYDGNYYVKSVAHHIRRGEYKQSFVITREGRISLNPMVVP